MIRRAFDVYKRKGMLVLIQASVDNIIYRLSKMISSVEYPKVMIHGSMMYLMFEDGGLSKQLFLHKTREPATTKIIKEIVKPNMTILEVGANIGYYALMEAKLMGDKGRVYAIEPFPKSFDILNKSIELNNYKCLTTYNIALSNEVGVKKLFLSNHYNTCNMNKDLGKGSIDIRTTTVDLFLSDKNQPDIVRMDLEGYEYFIIDGMRETLKTIKYLVVEWHPKYMTERDWESRIKLILSSGLKPLYATKKEKYRDEKMIEIDENNIFDVIKNSDWIGLVFKRDEK